MTTDDTDDDTSTTSNTTPGKPPGPTPQPPRFRKSQKRQRIFQIKTSLLKDEFNAIAAKADNAGLSKAAWSRSVMLGEPGPRARRRPHPDQKLLLQILGQVGRVGGNINQIARTLNEQRTAPDIPELRDALRAYIAIRDAIYEALGMDTTPPPDTPTKPGPRHDHQGHKPRQP